MCWTVGERLAGRLACCAGLATLTADEITGRDVTIAVGWSPNELVAAAVSALADLTGATPEEVDAGHEVYLTDPSVLTGVVTATDPR